MRSSIVFRSLSVLTIMVLGVASGCTGEGAECDPLDSENTCPQGDGFAQLCSIPDGTRCVNVCEGAQSLPGDTCERDANCASPLTCDNDRLAVSSCECVLACPSVGAAPDSVQAGGACSETADCAQDLTCDNEMVGISSCTCMAGTGGTGGTGGNGGTGGCTSASGELAISLDWKGGGDLDLGMQTPLGSVAPGFEGQPGADPDCTHGGNDTGTLGQETMTCPNPPAVGNYEIHVDSEADEVINFTLTVTVGGQHVSPLEFGIPPLQTGTSPVMSSIPAGSFQEWVTDFCLE